ncbi:LOW QUALITY PROTEIN: hypothetical protein MAR_016521 [Mya arenaria]|uniref:Uncharacterized protein n=1 Tax=Mya arenaria TaxID=6604 RepID=A0ABY7FLU3_MYAAR|nr:LOW QUALITY PROTEIN: hypothetical protein MAR_016521 [Mya arenaria]
MYLLKAQLSIHLRDEYFYNKVNFFFGMTFVTTFLSNSEATFITARSIDLESHPDYNFILVNDLTDSRKVKQRSPKWHAIRKKATVTGSTFFKALGFEGLKKQREHFQDIICGLPLPDSSEEAQKKT